MITYRIILVGHFTRQAIRFLLLNRKRLLEAVPIAPARIFAYWYSFFTLEKALCIY